ncbi:response regulator [Amycolatopsis sp. NPDC059657]|uniref:response regulator n=1 Tax=Amycolatopsis sp. NPDC059657 TaxID=3346899 RepID=UPI00366AD6DF
MTEEQPMRRERIKVGVIEDHPLYRDAVARVLAEADDIELGAVEDSVAKFAVSKQPPGSVIVLDLKLRGVADAAAVLEVNGMGHKVLVVSAHAGKNEVLGAIGAGAHGYLSKDADGEEILRAIRTIHAGNTYVSPTLASMVIDASHDRNAGPRIDLSKREREVLKLVAGGERDVDIAEDLGISVRTVRSYLDRIRDKTGERRRAGLTLIAIKEGIVPEPAVH